MSLIEQAAKRLEELKRAGQEVSGNLAYPTTHEEAPSEPLSTVELAAQRLRTLHARPDPVTAPPEPEPIPRVLRRHARPTAVDAVAEHEESAPVEIPVLASQPVAPTRRTPVPDPDDEPATVGESRSRHIDIDFERLAQRGLLTPDLPQSRIANEFRVAKRPLLNNCIGKSAGTVENARRIMVTSAVPGEGKSFVSLNLAMSIAMERDSTVLLVEGDPTRPSLATLMGIPPSKGLIDLLVDPNLDVSDVLIRTNLGRLSFIPAGTRHHHSTELLASKAMENLVNEVASRYEDRILIFDSPPILAAPEPRVLARYMGQVVFVIEAEGTSQGVVMEALSALEACPIVMTLLNKTTSQEAGYYYYYGSSN
ncbi:MAG: XrtA-associated tyrosine autokinase [Burkholderiales bacterium]|nr:XrtA-associated tyrosine autokinase [Burkholderiales bacterium]